MAFRLAGIIVLVSIPFFTAGIRLARLFKEFHDNMPRLYMADLLGPGVGTLAAILLMNTVQTLLTTFLICIPVIFAALIVPGGFRVVPVALMVLTAVLGWFCGRARNQAGSIRAGMVTHALVVTTWRVFFV